MLGQGYPNLEYIVLDGGSTDGSVEIIREYESQLAYWHSLRDNGMYNAINLGMTRATGEILGWLNSDDFYLPGALQFVANTLDRAAPELLFGNAFHFVQDSPENWGSDVQGENARKDLYKYDYLIQPASFWTRAACDKTGPLDESYKIVADWEWFARAKSIGVTMKPVSRYLAGYRIIRTSKTQAGGEPRNQELARVLAAYVGQEYARTFLRVVAQRDSIVPLHRSMRRWHLSRLERIVFRLLLPQVFGRVPPTEVWDMLEMIGYR